jgi:hypothetical protein
MERDTTYNDYLGPQSLGVTTFPAGKHKTFLGTSSPDEPTELWFLLPLTDANFEDRTQTNFSNVLIGKHNKAGGMVGQNGRYGFIHNPPIHENFLRANEVRVQSHGENPLRPYRIGPLMPTRGLKGRYQYKDAYYVQIDHVKDPQGTHVQKQASTISSSAYAWNSEIKFNQYVSIYPPAEESGEENNASLDLGSSSVNFTDITYSSSSTVLAFSPYSDDFGGSNYSSTPNQNQSQSLDPSLMSNEQDSVNSNPITSY